MSVETVTNTPPKRVQISYEEVKAKLPNMNWPLDVKGFQAYFPTMARTAAHMRLNDLVARGDLKRVAGKRFGLPHKDYGDERVRVRITSWDAFLEDLPNMQWPMTKLELQAEITAPYATKMEWIDRAISEGLLLRIGLAEFVYTNADLRTLDQLRPVNPDRVETGDHDYQMLLRRLPEEFTAAMFGQVVGEGPVHNARTLSRLKSNEWITSVERGVYKRPATTLPRTFGIGQFAYHFGLTTRDAVEEISELVNDGKLTVHEHPRAATHLQGVVMKPEVTYTATRDVLRALEQRLHDANAIVQPYEHERLQQLIEDVPSLPWPMSITQFAEHYGLSYTTARGNMDRLRLLGLIDVAPQTEGRHTLYRPTGRKTPVREVKEVRRLVKHNNRRPEAQEILGGKRRPRSEPDVTPEPPQDATPPVKKPAGQRRRKTTT